MMGRAMKRGLGSRRRLDLHAKAHGNVWLGADGEISS